MKLYEQIAALTGPIESTEIEDAIGVCGQAARAFIAMVPEGRRDLFIRELEVTAAGLATTFFQQAFHNGHQTRRIPLHQVRLRAGNRGIHKSLSWDPVHYFDGPLLFVLPEPTPGSPAYAYAIPMPALPADSALWPDLEAMPDIPEEAQHLVVLLAASMWTLSKAGDASVKAQGKAEAIADYLDDYITDFPVYTAPAFPTIPEIITDPSDLLDLSSIVLTITGMGTIPAYSPIAPPVIPGLDLSDIDVPEAPELPELGSMPTAPVAPTMTPFDPDDIDMPEAPELPDKPDDHTAPTRPELEKPEIPDVEYDPVTPPSFPTVTPGTTPAWVDPGSAPVPPDDVVMNEIYTRALKFIGSLTDPVSPATVYGSTGMPTGAFWLTDEDEEMVAAAVQLAETSLRAAQARYDGTATLARIYEAKVGASSSKLSSEVQAFSADINAKLGVLDGVIREYQAKLSAARDTLEGQIASARNKLEEYQTDAQVINQLYGLDVDVWRTKKQTDMEGWIGEMRALTEAFSTQVQAYNIQIRSLLDPWRAQEEIKLAIYQTDAQVYQALVRAAIDPYLAEMNGLTSAYNANVQAYGTLVRAHIDPWQAKGQMDIQLWSSRETANLQSWQTTVSRVLQEYEAVNTMAVQKARFDMDKAVGEYQTNLEAMVSDIRTKLESYSQLLQRSLAQYNADSERNRAKLESAQVASQSLALLFESGRTNMEKSILLRNQFIEELRIWSLDATPIIQAPQQ